MMIPHRNLESAEAPLRASSLERGLSLLDQAANFAAAQAALRDIGVAISMPLLAWAPDVCRPAFDQHMDTFLRGEGWSDEIVASWWNNSVMLKSPLYIRCRTNALPFVTGLSGRLPSRPIDLRRINESMSAMGVRSLITTPVHLPRGLVAMVTWGGAASKSEAGALLATIRPQLLAAGHLFMQAYLAETARFPASEEELAQFTPREWECLRLTAQGVREEQVATMLGLGGTTVRFHLDNVVRKLGAANRVHAVALAAQLGLLGPIG